MIKKNQLRINNYSLDDDACTVTVKVSEITGIFINYDDESDPYIAINLVNDRTCEHIYLNDDCDIIPTYFNILKNIQSVINSSNKHDEYIIIYDKDVFLLSEIEII